MATTTTKPKTLLDLNSRQLKQRIEAVHITNQLEAHIMLHRLAGVLHRTPLAKRGAALAKYQQRWPDLVTRCLKCCSQVGAKRLPTPEEKEQWSNVPLAEGIFNLYPLCGFVELDGKECPIERLREPGHLYEVHAPNGYHFAVELMHTKLCIDTADLYERLAGERLEPCQCSDDEKDEPVNVCVVCNPAVHGICGDPDCLCAPESEVAE
jgi:hypothetical protein